MPKVKYGAVITDSRGSLEGVTFSKNRGGSISRKRSIPTTSLTTRNSVVRSRQANLAKRWSSILTVAQRSGWVVLANANPVVDVFGNTRYLSGFQFYIRVNHIRQQSGAVILDTAPADQTGTAIATVVVTATTVPLVSIAFTATPTDADHRVYVFATPNLSPGKSNVTGLYKFLGASSLAKASPYVLTTEYGNLFGNPLSGRAIWFRVTSERDSRGVLLPSLVSQVIVL